MPPDASSRPEIGLNFTEASTSGKGPGGATMTLKAWPVLRWTSTLRPLGAPSISSTVHVPATVVHPVTSPYSKSKRLRVTRSRILTSAGAAIITTVPFSRPRRVSMALESPTGGQGPNAREELVHVQRRQPAVCDDRAPVDPDVGDRPGRHRVDDGGEQIGARVQRRVAEIDGHEVGELTTGDRAGVEAEHDRTRSSTEVERRLRAQRGSVEMADALQERCHPHLLEDREAVVRAAAVGAAPGANAGRPHLRSAPDPVPQEHVRRRTVGKRGTASRHQRDLVVVEPHAVYGDRPRPQHTERVEVRSEERRVGKACQEWGNG